MKTVTITKFRKRAPKIIRSLERGESYILTYRGRPVAKIISCPQRKVISSDDPLYRISEWAAKAGKKLKPVKADRLIYG